MLLNQILKNLRLLLLVVIGLVIGVSVGGLYYLNQTGANELWRQKIAEELENLGVTAEFNSLRYDPSLGLVAKGVRIYADQEKTETFAYMENLVIDVDKTKLVRGKFRINNASLSNAKIVLPIDPDDPLSKRIVIRKLNGNIFFPDKRTIEAKKITGMVDGIRLTLNANIWRKSLKNDKIKPQESSLKEARRKRIELVNRILDEIALWKWPKKTPPHLIIYAEGNVNAPDSAHLDFLLLADRLERDGVTLHDILIKGDFNNKIVTFDKIQIKDDWGSLTAQVDYQPGTRKARFEAKSSLHIKNILKKLFGVKVLEKIDFTSPPNLQCIGLLEFDAENKPKIQLVGKAQIERFKYDNTPFLKLQTEISLKGKNVYLTHLKATRKDGEISGRFLLKDGIIRYESQSSLPIKAYQPFLLSKIVKRELNKASFSPRSSVEIQSKGLINTTDLVDLSVCGHTKIKNFLYKGVSMKLAEADYAIMHDQLIFSHIKLVFNYRNYRWRKKYGGASTGVVYADKVEVDLKNKMVNIYNVRAHAWPAPVVRLFHDKAADHCEQYRFHAPPRLSASGSFDLNHSQARTNFRINVMMDGLTDYHFLGKDLTVKKLSGKVQIRQNRVDVRELSFVVFQGIVKGGISVNTHESAYEGVFHWERLHLKDLGELYEFNKAERGLITGRIEFNGRKSDIRNFNAEGVIGLEKGNLFSIPMLGPLSSVISKVLGKKDLTRERAKNASFNYVIRKGVMYSNNFLANTRSLIFTGEGKIDLHSGEIDLLVRMNARGVLGIFALPLKPFMGLFQFKGTGKISDSKWKSAMFTAPKRGKKDPIFRTPPKARVINE